MRHFLLIVGFIVLITACVDNTIYFDKPQPDGVKDLEQLPFWYRGVYIDKDSSFLIIDKSMIIQKYQIQWTISKQDLDTIKNLVLDGDILINKQSKERIKIKIKNDTILVSESKIDTLFRLSKDNLARKFKGNLILNYKQDDDSWRVEIYSLRWRTMKFMTINSKDIFNKLSTISESEVISDSSQTDTLKMILKPTKKQFKTIMTLRDSMILNEYKKIK